MSAAALSLALALFSPCGDRRAVARWPVRLLSLAPDLNQSPVSSNQPCKSLPSPADRIGCAHSVRRRRSGARSLLPSSSDVGSTLRTSGVIVAHSGVSSLDSAAPLPGGAALSRDAHGRLSRDRSCRQAGDRACLQCSRVPVPHPRGSLR